MNVQMGKNVASERALLIVSCPQQHRILFSDCGFHRLLGFDEVTILGQSMNILFGPETNPSIVSFCLFNARDPVNAAAQITLYTNDGHPRRMIARFSVINEHSADRAIIVLLMPSSDAIQKSSITHSDLHQPMALISSHSPHIISNVNGLFIATFGLPRSNCGITGTPISSIFKASSSYEKLAALIYFAIIRDTAETTITVNLGPEDRQFRVRCMPAFDSADERMNSVAMLFLPLASELPHQVFFSETRPAAPSDFVLPAIVDASATPSSLSRSLPTPQPPRLATTSQLFGLPCPGALETGARVSAAAHIGGGSSSSSPPPPPPPRSPLPRFNGGLIRVLSSAAASAPADPRPPTGGPARLAVEPDSDDHTRMPVFSAYPAGKLVKLPAANAASGLALLSDPLGCCCGCGCCRCRGALRLCGGLGGRGEGIRARMGLLGPGYAGRLWEMDTRPTAAQRASIFLCPVPPLVGTSPPPPPPPQRMDQAYIRRLRRRLTARAPFNHPQRVRPPGPRPSRPEPAS